MEGRMEGSYSSAYSLITFIIIFFNNIHHYCASFQNNNYTLCNRTISQYACIGLLSLYNASIKHLHFVAAAS